MTSTQRIVSVFILVGAFVAVDLSAQTLADVARVERERKKHLQSRVTFVSGGSTTAAPAATTPAATTPAVPARSADGAEKSPEKKDEAAAPKPPVGPTDNKGRDEKFWRDTFKKAREDSQRADAGVQTLELRLKDLNTQLLQRSDIYNRENVLGPEITAAQKELDGARADAARAKQKVADLEEELRRSNGPPGWAR